VSDTPRTDRWIKNINGWHYVQIERCRELEQELNAANKTIRLQHELIATAEKRGVDKAKEELNAANERIKRLEEELERTKQDRNAIAKNTREPLLLKLDHAAERIKRLEDRIHRAAMAFFRDGSDGHVASQMLQILEEERGKQ